MNLPPGINGLRDAMAAHHRLGKTVLWRCADRRKSHLGKVYIVFLLLHLPNTNAAFANDACRVPGAFGDLVENILILPEDGSRIGIRLPKEYWEIYPKMIGGYEDGSFHLRLDMETLAPVSPEETLTRKNEGRWDYLFVRIWWMIPLEEIAIGFAQFGAKAEISEIPGSLGEVHGLEWLDTEGSSKSASPIDDIYVSRDDRGQLNAVINCDPPFSPDLMHPACDHYFFSRGVGVTMFYFRQYLDGAMDFQSRVSDFVSCAVNPAPGQR